MRKLILVGVVGFVAQLIDGALGMSYGVTSTTLLLTVGVAPAVASASVHLAEIGTTLASGTAHWRFGNVSWRTVGLMTGPGFAGAFLGAVALSSLSAEAAEPIMALILFSLGVFILIKFLKPPTPAAPRPVPKDRKLPWYALSPLGLFGGFMDAAGGGGWGPIGTSTLLSSGRLEPRKVVGSIDTGEFLVALGASLGFLVALPLSQLNFAFVGALLVSGLIAAPLAAYLVRLLPGRVLGAAVGGIILLTNAGTMGEEVGIGSQAKVVLYVVIAVTWVASISLAVIAVRREREWLGQGGLEPA